MMKLFFAKIVDGLELFCESNEPVGYFRKKLQAVNYLRKKNSIIDISHVLKYASDHRPVTCLKLAV